MLVCFFVFVHRPDISAIRDRAALQSSNTNQLTAMQFQPPALEDLEAPRRQTSLDGEAIKIIIHDVDSGPFLASKRRVTLRRDPTDKAHRSNAICGIRKSNKSCLFLNALSLFSFMLIMIQIYNVCLLILCVLFSSLLFFIFHKLMPQTNSSRFWNACRWW